MSILKMCQSSFILWVVVEGGQACVVFFSFLVDTRRRADSDGRHESRRALKLEMIASVSPETSQPCVCVLETLDGRINK